MDRTTFWPAAVLVILFLVFGLVLASCGGGASPSNTNPPGATPTTGADGVAPKPINYETDTDGWILIGDNARIWLKEYRTTDGGLCVIIYSSSLESVTVTCP